VVIRSTRSLTRAQVGQGLLLAAIFTVGAVFRLSTLGSIRLTYDNSYTIYDSLRGLAGAGWPVMGQYSSVFLPSGILMTYVEALPLLVWRSPWAVAIFIVSLNTLAIGFVFWAARKLLGNAAGYIAAFLFAINPWVVFYSREMWVSSLMPFFVTLIAASLWPVLATDRHSAKGIIVAALAVTAMTQTYVASLGLLISIGLLLILFRKVIPRRPVLIGSLVFVAAMIVYGLGLVAQWNTTVADLGKFLTGGGTWHFTREGIDHALRFVTGMDFHAQYRELALGSDILANVSVIFYGFLTIVLAIGIGLAVRAIWQKRPERRAGIVLLVWYTVPILLMTVTSHQVHPYYLLLSVPAGQLLTAWGFLPFMRRPFGRAAVALALCGCAIVFGLNWHWFNVNVAQHPTMPKLDGWTLETATQMGDVVRQLTDDEATGSRVVVDARPQLIGAASGKYARVLSGIDYPNYVVLPGNQSLLYLLINQPPTTVNFGSHAQAFPEKDLHFADGTQVSFVRVAPYDHAQALELPQVKVDWPSAAGLTFLGYTLKGAAQPGNPINLATYWRVDERTEINGENFVGASYQLFDSNGQRQAQADGHGQWARRWQAGDVYVEQVRVDLPANLEAGDYDLKVGLFDSIHQQSFEFAAPQGAHAAFNIPVTIAAH
jgi:4-amino-4-deoxy-L-arabinose transferase-like glycosyltransferase